MCEAAASKFDVGQYDLHHALHATRQALALSNGDVAGNEDEAGAATEAPPPPQYATWGDVPKGTKVTVCRCGFSTSDNRAKHGYLSRRCLTNLRRLQRDKTQCEGEGAPPPAPAARACQQDTKSAIHKVLTLTLTLI